MAQSKRTHPIERWLQDDSKRTIFIICVALSAVFWLLSKLSRPYTALVNIPVHFENFPDDRLWMASHDQLLDMEVEAYGFDLIGYSWRNRQSVSIDFSKIELRQRRNEAHRAYLSTSDLRPLITNSLNGSAIVRMISPDTLYFPFALRADKSLPVKVQSNIEFKPGYEATGDWSIEPKQVSVSGRKAVIDTLKYLTTQPINKVNVSDSIRITIGLDLLDSTLLFAPDKVVLTLPVEQFTETEYIVPIQLIGVPDSISLRVFPREVRVLCRVPLSRYKTLSSDDFILSLDFAAIEKAGGEKIRPEWTVWPEQAILSRLDPERLEYLMVQK